MHLPEIEVVGPHVSEGLGQMIQRSAFTAVMRFTGEKYFASPLPQGLAVV